MESNNGMYERIYQRCSELNITPGAICDKLGIRRALITELKNSKSGNMSGTNIIAFAKELRVSTDWLLTGEDFHQTEIDGIGEVTSVDIALLKAWRESTSDEKESIAFSLRKYGLYDIYLSDEKNKQKIEDAG